MNFRRRVSPNGTPPLDPATTIMTSTKSAYETMPAWPPSDWNGGRDQIGIGGRLRRNPQINSLKLGGQGFFGYRRRYFNDHPGICGAGPFDFKRNREPSRACVSA
jgi:hypothetical protein